jgi:hypothetical protein
MPIFKTTYNIFSDTQHDELYDANAYDSNKVILPPGGPDDPKAQWDYNRPMTIEDVDIWEQLYWQGGGLGVYVAWLPYAEFYMITPSGLLYHEQKSTSKVELFYGPGADFRVQKRIKELGISIPVNKVWVDPKDMWLYDPTHTATKNIFTFKT